MFIELELAKQRQAELIQVADQAHLVQVSNHRDQVRKRFLRHYQVRRILFRLFPRLAYRIALP